jgi:Na+-transporting NADH:ubiquinone oxidoreductase subunit B
VLGAGLGALFLVWSGMASWRVMAGAIVGIVAISLIGNEFAPQHPLLSIPWHWQMVLGAFAFGAVFIATDPVTGPMTDPGRWAYGLMFGALTVLIRAGNVSCYEGTVFAILLASLFSPLVDYVVVEQNIRRRGRRLMESADAAPSQ